jgi:hypothetical protein
MLTEVANTLWKLQRADQLAGLNPQQLLLDARELVDRLEPDRHLQAEALALACHLNHPVYDCLYLALARLAKLVHKVCFQRRHADGLPQRWCLRWVVAIAGRRALEILCGHGVEQLRTTDSVRPDVDTRFRWTGKQPFLKRKDHLLLEERIRSNTAKNHHLIAGITVVMGTHDRPFAFAPDHRRQ